MGKQADKQTILRLDIKVSTSKFLVQMTYYYFEKMPQELFVLQCYNCNIFQAQIIKKVPKWICKMCGEKQSVKKVFVRGTGKECRTFVQEMNTKRLSSGVTSVTYAEDLPVKDGLAENPHKRRKTELDSKWLEYEDECPNENHDNKREKVTQEFPEIDISVGEASSKWSDYCGKNSAAPEENIERSVRNTSENSRQSPIKRVVTKSIFEQEENNLDVLLEL